MSLLEIHVLGSPVLREVTTPVDAVTDEMLGMRLLSLHNVHFLVSLMRDARRAVLDGSFDAWSDAWLRRYHSSRPDLPR